MAQHYLAFEVAESVLTRLPFHLYKRKDRIPAMRREALRCDTFLRLELGDPMPSACVTCQDGFDTAEDTQVAEMSAASGWICVSYRVSGVFRRFIQSKWCFYAFYKNIESVVFLGAL